MKGKHSPQSAKNAGIVETADGEPEYANRLNRENPCVIGSGSFVAWLEGNARISQSGEKRGQVTTRDGLAENELARYAMDGCGHWRLISLITLGFLFRFAVGLILSSEAGAWGAQQFAIHERRRSFQVCANGGD